MPGGRLAKSLSLRGHLRSPFDLDDAALEYMRHHWDVLRSGIGAPAARNHGTFTPAPDQVVPEALAEVTFAATPEELAV